MPTYVSMPQINLPSVRISFWYVRSVHTSVPNAYARSTPSVPYVRKWCVCSGYASVPDPYAHQMHQFLTLMNWVPTSSWCLCSSCFEGTMLCVPVLDLCAHRMHKFLMLMPDSVPYAHAEGTKNERLKNREIDAHAEQIRMCVSSCTATNSFSGNCATSVPISTFMCPRIRPHIFLQQNSKIDCGNI
jgi:hypothetical protein